MFSTLKKERMTKEAKRKRARDKTLVWIVLATVTACSSLMGIGIILSLSNIIIR